MNKRINDQNKSFGLFLRQYLLDKHSLHLVEKITEYCEVYIFSGVIRDFLTGIISDERDVDIVVEKKLPIGFFDISDLRPYTIRRNQFGGLKLIKDGITIDIWYLEDTWGLNALQLRSTPYSLIRTVFFNFSAITFAYKRQRFICDNQFIHFLDSHLIDVVCERNPNIPLCIVNAMHFKEKLTMELAPRLQRWLIRNYNDKLNFDDTQLQHYGKILYTRQQIIDFIEDLQNGKHRLG